MGLVLRLSLVTFTETIRSYRPSHLSFGGPWSVGPKFSTGVEDDRSLRTCVLNWRQGVEGVGLLSRSLSSWIGD